MLEVIRKVYRIGWLKSLYLNLRLLPFRQAILLPIIVSRSTRFCSLKGRAFITCKPSFGLVKIGFVHSDFVHWRDMTNFLNIKGEVNFGGRINFGVGTKLIVDRGAFFEIANNASIGYDFKLICRERISIGENFRAAWNVQIIDTNFHYTKDTTSGLVKRKTKSITIGCNNWIGNRSSVMQGAHTPDFLIVASNSLLNKDYVKDVNPYSLVAGSPAKFIRGNIVRVLDREEREINELFFGQNEEVFIDPLPRKIN